MALTDLYFLCKYILGFWWLCWQPHKEFADNIQAGIDLDLTPLYLLPRGHCKTLIFTVGHTIQIYLNTPTESIAIICALNKISEWKMRVLKQIVETNVPLHDLFPGLFWPLPTGQPKRGIKWDSTELVLPGGVEVPRQEPSIGCYGLDNMPTSLHFKIIKCDDLVIPETVTTMEQMKKSADNYGTIDSSILMPMGYISICGTIYDDADIHRTMEDAPEVYSTYKRPASYNPANGLPLLPMDPKAVALWPEQFPLNVLEKKRSNPLVGDYIFSCQFLLDPVPDDKNAFFNIANFQRYLKLPEYLRIYAGADLAISELDSACDTAIVVVGIDRNNDMYIIDVHYGKWNGMEIVDRLLHVQALYKPRLFGLEGENIQKALMPFLRSEMRDTGVHLNLPGGKATSPVKDKMARARAAQGAVEQHSVFMPDKSLKNEHPWLDFFQLQARRFPFGKDKDMIDAWSVIMSYRASMASAKLLAEKSELRKQKKGLDRRNKDMVSVFTENLV
jgi:predicted phage terminase large subunit-like protein